MKNCKRLLGIIGIGLGIAAVSQQLKRPAEDRDWHGTVAGVPYDLRRPTLARVRERWWNPDDARLFTPHVFGVGWSINLHRLTGMCCSTRDEGQAG